MGTRPVIFVRGRDGQVRVFYNTCPHRGAIVCRQDQGKATTLARRFVPESKGRDPECGEIREQDAQLVIDMLRQNGDITGDVTPEDYIDDRFIGC